MLGMLVYCRMNIMMMQKTDEKMFRDVDPFDLSKLTEWPDYEEEVETCSQFVDENGSVGTSGSSFDDTSADNASLIHPASSLSEVCVTYVDDADGFEDFTFDF
ncbi:unnamed protein product, partial [Cuscuta europaea]